MRDYVTLVAVERNQAGSYSEFLLAYRWSTNVQTNAVALWAGNTGLSVRADDATIDLQGAQPAAKELSAREEFFAPFPGETVTSSYPTDFKILREIAASRELTVQMLQDDDPTPLRLLSDGREALLQFVNKLSSP